MYTIDIALPYWYTWASIEDFEFERRKIPASLDQLLVGALHDRVHEELGPVKRIPKSRIRKRHATD